jgi:hypothetical protein
MFYTICMRRDCGHQSLHQSLMDAIQDQSISLLRNEMQAKHQMMKKLFGVPVTRQWSEEAPIGAPRVGVGL